jgi:hypothetical protein
LQRSVSPACPRLMIARKRAQLQNIKGHILLLNHLLGF